LLGGGDRAKSKVKFHASKIGHDQNLPLLAINVGKEINNMIQKPRDHKQKINIITILLIASVISVALAIFRMQRSGTLHYRNLIWNLILAWIPLIFSLLAYVSTISQKPILYIIILVSTIVWLLFFPNAPYIITDFQYLSLVRDSVPVWYDVILLVWFAWTGLLLGIVSLYLMQEIVKRVLGSSMSWLFVVVSIGLGSYGIYLGRFDRWNSWDVFENPRTFIFDLITTFRHPLGNLYLLGFTLLFALFFFFIYLFHVTFAKMMSE
jgi:uncharacterized membrane protein